jgi:hypothetical protein
MAKSVDEMFAGIKPEKHVRPKKAIRVAEPVGPVVSETDKMVTVALTMRRELFERYNTGKNRNRFRDAMVRQLERKFE